MTDLIGYKIMRTENGRVIAGADSRQSFDLELGTDIKMQGNGIYLGMSKDYVMTYYSGLADEEVLLTLQFKKSDIIVGDLNDKEPELSLKTVKVIGIEYLEEGELIEKPVKKANSKLKI